MCEGHQEVFGGLFGKVLNFTVGCCEGSCVVLKWLFKYREGDQGVLGRVGILGPYLAVV